MSNDDDIDPMAPTLKSAAFEKVGEKDLAVSFPLTPIER